MLEVPVFGKDRKFKSKTVHDNGSYTVYYDDGTYTCFTQDHRLISGTNTKKEQEEWNQYCIKLGVEERLNKKKIFRKRLLIGFAILTLYILIKII